MFRPILAEANSSKIFGRPREKSMSSDQWISSLAQVNKCPLVVAFVWEILPLKQALGLEKLGNASPSKKVTQIHPQQREPLAMNKQEGSRRTGPYYDAISGLCTLEHVAEDREWGVPGWLRSKPNYAKMWISIPLSVSCGCSSETDRHKQAE